MDPVGSLRTTAGELVVLGRRDGVDLTPVCHDFLFTDGRRCIFLWRDGGRVRYNMQGRVAALPAEFAASAGAFRGGWHESGAVPGPAEALALVRAWVVEGSEVDELPDRDRRRWGIG